MKKMITVGLAASAILVIGGGRAALAQPIEFPVSVNVNLKIFGEQFEGLSYVLRDGLKVCRPTPTSTQVEVTAEGPPPPELDGMRVNVSGFPCVLSGVQCGFDETLADSSFAGIDNKNVFSVRCSASRKTQ